MKYKNISFEIKNDHLWIGFGLNSVKSMTTLDRPTLEEFKEVVLETSKLDKDNKIKGVFFYSHKPDVFLAGVDVSVINSLTSEAQAIKGVEEGQSLYNKIEDLKVPTAALIDGVCLGGGLELALSCDKIFITDNSKTALGLPEVMLGVLPGFGGTYRLPRKVGLLTAMDMILTGKQIKGKKCVQIGLAQAYLPKERLIELAPQYLHKKSKPKNDNMVNKVTTIAQETYLARKIIFQKAREKVLDSTKGFYPAPLKILDVLDSAYGRNRTSYLAIEAQAFAELSQSYQSKNLQHIFFMTDAAKKIENKDQLKDIKRSAVLGAGVMGGGIAWLLAQNNQSPYMKDINNDALDLGLKQSAQIFSSMVKRKKMSEDDFQRKQRSILPTLSFEGFRSVDLVIEAVVENMEIKKKVLAELETHVREDTLITSNTSSLSLGQMGEALKDSSRFCGLHFFNPVNKMPLVEIISHPKVNPETIRALYKWSLAAKKTPIVVNDGPGFLVNRILAPYLNEAAFLLSEGVSIDELDQAALNFGMPMGPCRLMDEIGLDVCAKVGSIMYNGLGDRHKPNDLSLKLVEEKLMGKKNLKGFYQYDEAGKVIGKNSKIFELLNVTKKKMDESLIYQRLFYPMINEASYILAENICDRAQTVDIGLIYGVGFPPFKGGLLKFADFEGLLKICNKLDEFSQSVSLERFKKSDFLEDLQKNHKTFYEAKP